MTKRISIFQHLRAIMLLPFIVIVVIPILMLKLLPQWNLSHFVGLPGELLFGMGILLFLMSAAFFISTLVLFVRISRGTLAPWDPSQKLVVRSYYRHSRNPMILGVISLLLSLAFFFDSVSLLGWCGVFFFVNHLYIRFKEEPGLEQRFGEEYNTYRRNVPRWMPRRKGWRPEDIKGSH